jgi:hypothetical protein
VLCFRRLFRNRHYGFHGLFRRGCVLSHRRALFLYHFLFMRCRFLALVVGWRLLVYLR